MRTDGAAWRVRTGPRLLAVEDGAGDDAADVTISGPPATVLRWVWNREGAGEPSGVTSFPRTDWAWAIKQACTQAASADLGYGDPRGSSVLREVLAGYLRRVRAAAASPARMNISTGFAQGINLLLRALARQGGVTCVAFEDPGYGSAQADETVRAALAMGIHVTYLPVDEQGLVVGELAASGAQAVVVTPAHQHPTGVVQLTDRLAAALATAISDTSAVPPPIARLQGIALAGVFQIIISESGQRTRAGQSQAQIVDDLHPIVETVLDELDRWLRVSGDRQSGC